MQSLDELLPTIPKRPLKTIAVACPEDIEVLTSVFEARRLNLCSFLLFGNKLIIEQKINEMKTKADEHVKIINVPNNELACVEAVMAVSTGKAQVLMKGLVDTAVLLKAALNRDYGLRTNHILSHVMVCELPKLKRLILLSDGAMNIDPSPDELKQITLNALKLARFLKINNPNVALLSAVEKVNPKMTSTLKCQAVQTMYDNGEITGCNLLGPIALDLALDEEAARIKRINHPVAGRADILIAPAIEVANVLYKGWVFGCYHIKTAGLIMGAKAPIVLTSRADSHESKLYSIALSLLVEDDNE